MFEGLGEFLALSEDAIAAFVLVFTRVGAVMALLPAFGQQLIPARVRLGLTFAFSLVVFPMLAQDVIAVDADKTFERLLITEAAIGFAIGIVIRLMVIALQLAGSIASQSTALAQIFGAGATPDPMPAIGNILMMAGVTLAVVQGLHVKASIAMARSYEILPVGMIFTGADVAAWGVAHVAQAFAFGFSMAAPFVIAAFAYNLALGAINKAMPSLMVAFIGAPAITAGGILILLLGAPVILQYWSGRFDEVLANPLALPR